MPMSPPRLTGPLRVVVAIALAKLPSREKAILNALIPHLDWKDWTCYPSIATIAANCGRGTRHVQDVLTELERRGLICYVRRSAGGASHRFRLDIERLESLADPARRAGFDQAPDAGKPCKPRAQTLQAARTNPAPAAEEHTREQTDEQTTATAGSGSGRLFAPRDRVERLIAAGIASAAAETLASLPDLTSDKLAFVLDRARQASPKHPGRYVAKLLRTSTAELDGFDTFRTGWLNRRQNRYRAIMREAGSRGGADPAIRAQAELIRSVWPTGPAFAESGVIADSDLLCTTPDWGRLFRLLHEAARAQIQSESEAA